MDDFSAEQGWRQLWQLWIVDILIFPWKTTNPSCFLSRSRYKSQWDISWLFWVEIIEIITFGPWKQASFSSKMSHLCITDALQTTITRLWKHKQLLWYFQSMMMFSYEHDECICRPTRVLCACTTNNQVYTTLDDELRHYSTLWGRARDHLNNGHVKTSANQRNSPQEEGSLRAASSSWLILRNPRSFFFDKCFTLVAETTCNTCAFRSISYSNVSRYMETIWAIGFLIAMNAPLFVWFYLCVPVFLPPS